MLALDITQALHFLDMLDPGGRHTLASEAPFGGPGNGPKWEGGATYEERFRSDLVKDIEARQARGSNVYYSVNRPCPASDQKGYRGKCNVDDIIAIRALAFDIDFKDKKNPQIEPLLGFVNGKLVGPTRPSSVISTGGGFHLIYVLSQIVNVELFRPAVNDDQERHNKQVVADRSAISKLAKDFELLLGKLVPPSLPIKIDSMSNVDRVMRLPGTVNHPNAEKRARGQVESLAHILVDYQHRCDIFELRKRVPKITVGPPILRVVNFVPNPKSKWPP